MKLGPSVVMLLLLFWLSGATRTTLTRLSSLWETQEVTLTRSCSHRPSLRCLTDLSRQLERVKVRRVSLDNLNKACACLRTLGLLKNVQ